MGLEELENTDFRGSRHDDKLIGTAGNDRLYGKQGNDWLEGGDGDDTIKAGSGNDRIYGGDGNDTLIGGNKGNDRAVYKGRFKQYDIQQIGEQEWTIEPRNSRLSKKLREGKDTLKGIESLEFNDQTYRLKYHSPLLVSKSSASSQLLYTAAKPEFSLQNSNLMVDTNSVTSRGLYVATNGDDTNPGTIEAPFKTIQHAVSAVRPGDIVNIRAGTYRETVTLDNINGAENNPITFKNYNSENVILSGTTEITTRWAVHSGNIWKTNIWTGSDDVDISQLFLDEKMLTGARWPNINKDYDQPDADFWHTWSSANKIADGSYEDNGGLASLGISIEGATAYMKGLGAAEIISHNAGEANFLSDPLAVNQTTRGMLGGGDYFIEGDIDLLDKPREWYYDRNTGDLFAWLEGNQNPNNVNIEARTHERGGYQGNNLIQINSSEHLRFDGLNLFSGAFNIVNSDHIRYENSSFLYPAHNGLMLGKNQFPGGNIFIGVRDYASDLILKNNEFAYSYGLLFEAGRHSTSQIYLENNHFYNSNIMLWGSNGGPIVMGQSNVTAIRNSVHDMGWGGLGRPGHNNRLELNHIYDTKWSSDTGAITANQSVENLVVRRNWVHGMPRNGIRFDGHPGGIGQTIDNNIVFNNGRGYMLKGDQHQIHNNLALNNGEDFSIPDSKFYGYRGEGRTKDDRIISRDTSLPRKGNHLSVAHNNAANSMAQIPIQNPEDKTNNSSKSTRSGVFLQDQLRDPANFDFRPRPGSSLIDSGILIAGVTDAVEGVTDGPLGSAPDIGPYEYGDSTYWIPGHQTDKARMPIAPDLSRTVKVNADLIWLQGRDAIANHVYFGTDSDDLAFKSRQTNNIYTPGSLDLGQTYYWRIDTETDDGVVTGDRWEFTVNNLVNKVEIESVYVGDLNNPNGRKRVDAKKIMAVFLMAITLASMRLRMTSIRFFLIILLAIWILMLFGTPTWIYSVKGPMETGFIELLKVNRGILSITSVGRMQRVFVTG